MTKLESFVERSKISEMTEVEKGCHLAYFYMKFEGVEEFSTAKIANWLRPLNFPQPNTSRLTKNLAACSDTVRGSSPDTFRLHRNFIRRMEDKYPELNPKSQEVEDHGAVLPEILYTGMPGYVQSISKQINASYENNIFDGCAVLMRRLEEILLILAYEYLGISAVIKDTSGNYLMLEAIVKNAVGNAQLNLSRNSRKTVETIRELGNFSAHKITYTCKREYIEQQINQFRALIDELLHKSGLKA